MTTKRLDSPPVAPSPSRKRRRFAAALTIALAATSVLAGAQEQSATADSLDRVRAALAKPPSKLTLKERTPDFTVRIEKRRPMADIFDVPLWATDPVGWQPPALGFDLLSLFRYVAKSAADAKRGRDLRLAREDVQRSIADYCAALPADAAAAADRQSSGDASGASAAQICSTSPAIR
ncbi:MAG TPA: hypothetical protein VKD69_00530 [Vicinamibacterales bacterium]|nr:hypothetical protein [Vicinamibacterales bacterium]